MTGSDQHDVARSRERDSLTGEVRSPGAPARPFIGWIGLLSALQAVVNRLRADGTSEEGSRGPVTVAVDVEWDLQRGSSHPNDQEER